MKSKSAAAPRTRAKKPAAVAKTRPSEHSSHLVIIETAADVATAMRALRRTCPVMRRMHDLAGDPPLRRREPGLEGLVRIVAGQQVSVASANAIWTRVEQTVTPLTAKRLLAMTDAEYRETGLSRPKVKTLRAVAAAIRDGLDLQALANIDEAIARDRLTAISGIGPWTADIFLMFCLGRADVFAPGDLALQIAWQRAVEADARPTTKEMAMIAARWAPYRAVAALMLWSYYRVAKAARSGAPV